jgi:hypothetical protein
VTDDDKVHLLAVSNHSSRLVIRSYDTASLRDVKQNLKGYFAALSMGSKYAPSLFRIVKSLHPKLEPEKWMKKAKGHVVKLAEKFLRRAIVGSPLGEDVMAKATRMFVRSAFLQEKTDEETRKAKRIARQTLCGIIHLSYNEIRKDGKMSELKPYLDEENRDKMYLAGRLQALYEDLQSYAYYLDNKGNMPGRTFHDRFFRSMVSNPGMTLPRLATEASRHLYRKIRRKNERAAFRKQQAIQNLHAEVAPLEPGPTSPRDRALFISGYFHQAKKIRDDVRERAADLGSAPSDEEATE